jgi:hypothetical protein
MPHHKMTKKNTAIEAHPNSTEAFVYVNYAEYLFDPTLRTSKISNLWICCFKKFISSVVEQG